MLLLLLLLLLLLEFIRLGPTRILTNAAYETVGPANYDIISSSLKKTAVFDSIVAENYQQLPIASEYHTRTL